MANYNPKFTCACKSPRNNNIVFIGTNAGQIYRVEIKNLSEIQKNLSLNFSCIDNISPYNREIKPFYSPVRAIKRLDVSNLISISTNGGIKLINLLLKKYIELQAEKSDTEHRLWRILVINQKKFIVVGSYGKMQLWENENNIWKKKIDKRHGSPSFFCLNWYNKYEDKIISNDYRGSTELWNTNLKFLKSWNLASNIQESIKIDNRLITVTYFGDTIVYLKDEDNFIQIERFSCSKMKSVSIIRQISNGEDFLAGFNNKIFLFDKSFTEYRSADISCIDLISIGNIELILTAYDLVPLDRSKLVIPENYIKYKYIHVGFVGNSRSGKTTICKYLIKNRYISEIPSSLGTHIWLHELSNKKKIYYIDMAGQESELPYYLPKLKTCQIIFVLFRHNQSKKEFMHAIDYYNLLSNKLTSCQIYLIESMMDEREGISKRFKEKKLNQNNIPMKNWIKISVKEGININSIISILNDEGIWDSAYPITESSINNAILSILQELYETKFQYVSIEEMQIPLKKKYGKVKLSELRNILEKLANEGLVFFLEESDKIILDTSDKQKIQSKILMVLHEENGFIQLEKLLEFSKEDLGELESMEEYISKFLNYLEKEELAMLVPIKEEVKNLSDIDQIILWDALVDKQLIDFDITQFEKIEFRLENPIQIIELIFFGKKNLGRLEFINRNKLYFEGTEKIIFDLIDNEISSDSKHSHIKIYIKDSPEKKRIIIEFLGENYLISSNSSISYSLDEYVELVNEGECETIEFKSTFKWDIKESRANKELPEMVTKSICAFSNSRQGGIVFIGIKDDRSIFGIENDIEKIFHNSYDIFQQEVAKKIRKDLGQSVIYKTDKIELKNKQVFTIKVEPAKNPIYFKNNEYYVRRGSSNHNCTPKETEEHIKSRFP